MLEVLSQKEDSSYIEIWPILSSLQKNKLFFFFLSFGYMAQKDESYGQISIRNIFFLNDQREK